MLLPEDEVVEGVKGGRIEFELGLIDENGRPVDTTVYDEFKVCIKIDSSTTVEISQVANANGSIMSKVGAATSGVFKIVINPADSLLLNDGERQDISFQMNENADATNVIRLLFKDRLSIFKSSCA